MTDKTPSDRAKRKACELANALETSPGIVWIEADIECATLRALALHLDEVDRVASWAVKAGYDTLEMRSLMLPDPPDPDEELAREIAKDVWVKIGTGGEQEAMEQAALATIKRLREQGRLTDAK